MVKTSSTDLILAQELNLILDSLQVGIMREQMTEFKMNADVYVIMFDVIKKLRNTNYLYKKELLAAFYIYTIKIGYRKIDNFNFTEFDRYITNIIKGDEILCQIF